MDARGPPTHSHLPPLQPQPEHYALQHQPQHQHHLSHPSMLRPQPQPQMSAHHHHHHVHRHPGLPDVPPLDPGHAVLAFMPGNDRNELYYPKPYALYDAFQEHDGGDPGRGNWGRKLQIGGRTMRKRRLGTYGPYSGDLQIEERARKRIKLLLPEKAPSPPPLTIPRYHSLSPPASPHLLPADADPNPSMTSFLVAPGTRHSFNPFRLHDLGRMTLDLIESEGEGCRALGRLFSLVADKRGKDMQDDNPDEVMGDGNGNDNGNGTGNGNGEGSGERNGLGLDFGPVKEEPATPAVPQFPAGVNGNGTGHGQARRSSSPEGSGSPEAVPVPHEPPTLHTLFLTSGPLTLPDNPHFPDAQAYFPTPQDQLASVHQWLGQIRGVYDDLREYLRQLELVSVGLAEVDMGRRRVWRGVRREVARELGVEEGEEWKGGGGGGGGGSEDEIEDV